MKKVIKLNNDVSQKTVAIKKASDVSVKHQRHHAKKSIIMKRADGSDGSAVLTSHSIGSKPDGLEKNNQATLSLGLLLEAGRVLSSTKKANENQRPFDELANPPIFRNIAPLINARRRKTCHVIPPDGVDHVLSKAKILSDSSTTAHAELHQALHKAIYILDSPYLTDGAHFDSKRAVGPRHHFHPSRDEPSTSKSNPVPNYCRPIPPPPRLPRVPVGFAFPQKPCIRPRTVSNSSTVTHAAPES